MINTYITELVNYEIKNGLIDEFDRVYSVNKLIELMGLDEYAEPESVPEERDLHLILEDMLNWAFEHGVMESDTIAQKDLFDTKIIGAVTPPPSVVISKFNALLSESSKDATDWYYERFTRCNKRGESESLLLSSVHERHQDVQKGARSVERRENPRKERSMIVWSLGETRGFFIAIKMS